MDDTSLPNYSDLSLQSIRIDGDYKIHKVLIVPGDGNPIDFTNTRYDIFINEDIFQPCLQGTITISDSWDIPNLFPLIGEEKLHIIFKRQGTNSQGNGANAESLPETQTYDKVFRITQMHERTKTREKHQTYTLEFVSEEIIKNHSIKVMKSYRNKLYSTMVKEIYGEYIAVDKPIFVEKSKFKQNFCVSNLTPFDAINIFTTRAVPEKYKGSNYVFFEALDGFHFQTLEYLFDQPFVDELIYEYKNVMDQKTSSYIQKDIKRDVKTVSGYSHIQNFNVLRNLVSGMYGSTLITYDPVRQVFDEIDYDLNKEYEKYVHCDDKKFFRPDVLDAAGQTTSRYNLMSTNKNHDQIPWIAGKEPGIRPTKVEKYLQHRQSQLQHINNYTIALSFPGNPERTVGQIIKFHMPNAMGDSVRAREEDKYLSGNWLITRLTHHIAKNGYFLDCELIKDSFVNEIEYEDPLPIYKDVW